MSSLSALSTLLGHSMAVSVKCCSLLAQRHQPSSSVTLMIGRQQAILHHEHLQSTCEFMQSARIVFPCFTRPRFELGLSSGAPEVSAKRVRLSQPIRSQVLRFIPPDVVNICPMTNLSLSTFTRMVNAVDLFDDSAMLMLSRVFHGSATTGLCTFEASRLFFGITVIVGTDGFRVEGRYLLSLRCLWRWIGTFVFGIWATGWIRNDPGGRQCSRLVCLHLGWTGQAATGASSVAVALHGNLYRHFRH